MGDEFIRDWHARVGRATTEALGQLVRADVSPVSDGVLGDWLRALAGQRFSDVDIGLIAALIGKSDPHLQEAGVVLATVALHHADASSQFEAAIARMLARGEPDPWVLEALVGFLSGSRSSHAPIYEALAAMHLAQLDGKPSLPRPAALTTVIARNRFIDPWRRLITDVYEQHLMATLQPQPRDLAYLPGPGRVHGTDGREPTPPHGPVRMGFDPEDHVRRLRGMHV